MYTAWLAALMRSLGTSTPAGSLACRPGHLRMDLVGKGICKLHSEGSYVRLPLLRSLSQSAGAQSAAEALQDEAGTASSRLHIQLQPPGVQEVERQSWQDVAADREKEVAPAKKRKELPMKLYEDDEHSIRGVHIPRSAWLVLLKLRAAGHEGYVVGGAVRDLLLKGRPKDFDILTTATVHQVKNILHRSRLIGKRFPIVQAMVDGDTMEVSSFSTGVPLYDLPFDAAALLGNKKVQLGNLASSQGQSLLWKDARRQNALARDFTVNALMYDPFSRIIFDYTGGVQDCRRGVLRTIIDPETSFVQDPARMVRAIRLAARAGLKVDDATAKAIRAKQRLLLDLPQGRLSMEVHALLAYGSASETVKLMWRHELLDFMFPLLAGYLSEKKFPRAPRKPKTDLLFEVLARMDKRASPDYPLPSSVWNSVLVGFIALHMAAEFDNVLDAIPAKAVHSSTARMEEAIRQQTVSRSRATQSQGDSYRRDSDLQDDLEILGLAPVAAAPTPGEESDTENEDVDLETDPYMKVVAVLLEGFIDEGEAKCVSKAQRYPIYNILRSEHNYRKKISQDLALKCNACKRVTMVEMTAKSPKCDSCGHNLPTKRLKTARRPELMAVIDALQLCHQGQRKSR